MVATKLTDLLKLALFSRTGKTIVMVDFHERLESERQARLLQAEQSSLLKEARVKKLNKAGLDRINGIGTSPEDVFSDEDCILLRDFVSVMVEHQLPGARSLQRASATVEVTKKGWFGARYTAQRERRGPCFVGYQIGVLGNHYGEAVYICMDGMLRIEGHQDSYSTKGAQLIPIDKVKYVTPGFLKTVYYQEETHGGNVTKTGWEFESSTLERALVEVAVKYLP